jgi:pyrophosphatase PpaX
VLALHATGKRLGIVTSKFKAGAQRGLKLVGLDRAFEIIVGADNVTHPKPHPEPVLKALELLDADPERTVFIGDSRHDLECGRAAGVKTAAVLWGPFNRSHLEDLAPDYWLEKPAQLAQLYDS